MLDVQYGKNEDGTNIQIYSENGADAQQFKLVATNQDQTYGILTKCSMDSKALDVYNFGTSDGANVCEWTYYANSCQKWVFEACNNNSSQNQEVTSTPAPTTAPSNEAVSIEITSDWTSGATADVTITNLTGNDLNGWTCTFTTNRPITAFWNAELVSSEGNTYTIKNPAWASYLANGQSFTTGCAMGAGSQTVDVTNASIK